MKVNHTDVLSSVITQLWTNRHYIPEFTGVSADCDTTVTTLYRYYSDYRFEIQSITELDYAIINTTLRHAAPEYFGRFMLNGQWYVID